MQTQISFKIGDAVAANTIEGMQIGKITGGDPYKNQITIEWTDGKTINHNLNDTVQYRAFYLQKVMQA